MIKSLYIHFNINTQLPFNISFSNDFEQQFNSGQHLLLKGWMERFQGVATKYLDNYLYWFRWLDTGKNLAFEKRVEQMLVSACRKSNYVSVEMLRSV